MAQETILQHWIVTKFILPFLLMFVLVYAILEKTKLLGEKSHQVNAVVSGVIGLIFVGAVFPKLVVENMILFLVVAVIVVFVALLLWAFISGSDLKDNILGNNAIKWIVGIVLVVAVIFALLWATGVSTSAIDFFFKNDWSNTFWTNVIFIVVIAGVLALVLSKSKT